MVKLDSFEVTFHCPKCRHELKQTIAWLKAHTDITCPGCNSVVTLDTQGLAAVEEGQKAIDDFRAKLRKGLP